jgi:hypothetical protein
MNRYPVVLTCLLTLSLGAAAMYGAGSTMVVIEPKDMKDGEKKTVIDDGRTITVERDGDTTHVTIEGADKTEKLTITRDGNEVRIGRLQDGVTKSFVIGPDRPKITIDGVPLGDFDGVPLVRPLRPNKMHTYFVCPKDKTQLRVPEEKDDATYKCPVDGTVMEKKRGRGFTFYYDDQVFENLL